MIPIQNIINEQIFSGKKEPHEVLSWHPSKLGQCLRGVYLSRLGVKPDEEFTERELRIFNAGHLFEEWFIDLLKKDKTLKIETQVPIKDKVLDLSGYADAVIEQEGEKQALEIKSKHSRSFWYMKEKGEGPNRGHEYQLWIYLKLLGLEKGSIVYISKDDLTLLEYPISLHDETLAKEVLGILDILNTCWEKKIYPPMAKKGEWQAKYCRWHKQCQKIEDDSKVEKYKLVS